MTAEAYVTENREDLPFKTGMIISVFYHIAFLVAIPLVVGAVRGRSSFERPPVFRLVAAPPSLKSLLTESKSLVSSPARERRPVKPVPKGNEKQEETLEELASLLEEIPAPASISAAGDLKYNWYLAQAQRKIERFWNPPLEDRKDSVVVSFTIFKDGSVSDPVVYRKSENRTLNDLALQAVRLAAPFGKLPPGVAGDRYEIFCTLRPARN